jgi:hypothetical protein
MRKSILACICLSMLLSGCVLQSRTPIFSESDAGALPEALGTRFIMESHDRAAWTKQEGIFILRPEGQHYVASDGDKKSDVEALFVTLGSNWWVMQATAAGDPNVYMLAEWTGGALLLHPLNCSDLKSQPSAAAAISFEGDDCYLKGKPGVEYFLQFTTGTTPATMRLTPVT